MKKRSQKIFRRALGAALLLLLAFLFMAPDANSAETRCLTRPIKVGVSSGKKINRSNHTTINKPVYNRFRQTYGPTDVLGKPRNVDDWRKDWQVFRRAEGAGDTTIWTRTVAQTSQWRIVYGSPLGANTSFWTQVYQDVSYDITNAFEKTKDAKKTATGLKAVHRQGNKSDKKIKKAEEKSEEYFRSLPKDKDKKKKDSKKEGAYNGRAKLPENWTRQSWQPATAPQGGVHTQSAPRVTFSRERGLRFCPRPIMPSNFLRAQSVIIKPPCLERCFARLLASSSDDAPAA